MLPTINASSQRFLSTIEHTQTRLETAQRQIATGLKMTSASDAPDQVSAILQLAADLEHNSAIAASLTRTKTEVDSAEQALAGAVSLMDEAAITASQATGTDQTAATRATLALSIGSIIQQMVSISRTSSDGRYVFSGDMDQTPLYDVNASGGADRLLLTPATRKVQAPGGSTFSVSLSANDIFDLRDSLDAPATGNVFVALGNLRTALLNNDDAAIKAAIPGIQAASTHLNNELSFYGQAQARIADELTATTNTDVRLRTELATKREADMTAAIIELTQGQLQLKAAMQARAAMPKETLFDVI